MKKFGEYCFKINSIKLDPYLQDSEIKCVTFKQLPAFSSIIAPKNVIMTTKKINGIEGYTVEVPMVESALIYEFQVFKDIQGNELVYTTRSKNNIMTWISSKSGIYYYRYIR